MDLLSAIMWLSLNVYHESRSESPLAQIAVAQVTINRSKNRNLSIEQVVNQPFQFSWIQEGKLIPDDIDAFIKSIYYVKMASELPDITKGATHYHHVKVIPEWTNRMQYVGTFGVHKFYKKR